MEIISAVELISINETFFVQLISFLIFLFLLNRLMVRPLISIMEQRREYLEDVKNDIEKAKSDLHNLHREIDVQRAKVVKAANAVVRKLEEEADHRANELIGSAQAQVVQLRHDTEERVRQQVKAIRGTLSGEVEALTTLIMEKVLHRRLPS